MAEQPVVHVPELALRGRGLGRLGGHLRVRVHVGQRQVAEDVAQLVRRGARAARRSIGAACAAVRALEVAVLEQRDRRVGVAADVVALGIDVLGEVDDRLGGRAELARAHARRAAAARPGTRPRPAPGESDRGREHAELGLLEQRAFERERGDQQRDGEADARPTPRRRRSTGHVTVSRARRIRVASHVAPRMPTGLPIT